MRTLVRVTAAQRKRARRLTATEHAELALGPDVYDTSPILDTDTDGQLILAQSWSDGQCEYTLQITARRHSD